MRRIRSRSRAELTVDDEMGELSDFQRTTARHAFDRLYGESHASARFLVADEVGLGKTHVARGIVAQTIDHLQRAGNDRIDVIYVCSNQAIAQQNLSKIAPQGVAQVKTEERLSMLPFTLADIADSPVNLIALTPGTSLALGTSEGRLHERAAIFHALREIWRGWSLRGEGMGALFAGHRIGAGRYPTVDARFRAAAQEFRGQLSNEGCRLFRDQIELLDQHYDGGVHGTLRRLAKVYKKIPLKNMPADVKNERKAIIRDLRAAMATTGAQLLKPDLVVLDEFQRFRDVLHSTNGNGSSGNAADDYAAEIAQQLFASTHSDAGAHGRRTRILLLSATPYAMHTTAADTAEHGDEHYRDLLQTYQFLAEGIPGADAIALREQLADSLTDLRGAILSAGTHGTAPAHAAAAQVSDQLRQVMVRTERPSATADRDGMLTEIDDAIGVPDDQSLRQFRDTAALVDKLWPEHAKTAAPIGSVVNYWKAAPYTLSFLDGYKVLPDHDHLAAAHKDLTRSCAVLPWKSILNYEEVPAAHADLGKLWNDFFDDAHAERLLWLPPSLPYYKVDGDFGSHEAQQLTKRLIFSSWKMVPTAISTLTSYECERRLYQRGNTARQSGGFPYTSSPSTSRIDFRQDAGSMPNLLFDMVFPRLADLIDPLALSIELRKSGAPEPLLNGVLKRATDVVIEQLGQINTDTDPRQSHTSTAWYPLAALLLDGSDLNLLTTRLPPNEEKDVAEDLDSESGAVARSVKDEPRNLEKHFDKLRRLSSGRDARGLMPEDLAQTLALAAIAAPPMAAYRSLKRSFPDADDHTLVPAARHVASAVRNLFNRPNGHWAVMSLKTGTSMSDDEFWRRALHYCAAGNLQSVMDEYVAALVDNKGLNRRDDVDAAVIEAAQSIRSVIAMGTTTHQASTVAADHSLPIEEQPGTEQWRRVRLRTDFALPLVVDGTQGDNRRSANDVSAAFNSPFWPFIVTSTSVGQEGLDFHLYSHAITHWNLPTNPVDLEQREGRVHRYKGHAIRKNIARAGTFPSTTTTPWEALFDEARQSRPEDATDMVPYWVYVPNEPGVEIAQIERHMPIGPYTRERSIKDDLLASVSTYRMAFGQPRQDEFLRYALNRHSEELREELAAVRVRLTPPASEGDTHGDSR